MHQEDTNSGSTNQKSPDGTGPQSLLHNGQLSLLLKVLAATVHPSGAPQWSTPRAAGWQRNGIFSFFYFIVINTNGHRCLAATALESITLFM